MSLNKLCSNCRVLKSLVEFSVSRRSKDGKQSWCRQCDKDRKVENRLRVKALPVTITNKECVKCKITKSVENFRRDNSCKDLLSPWCRQCSNTYKSARHVKKMEEDTIYKAHHNLRRIIKGFRSPNASDDEIDSHRLVSVETYVAWLDFERGINPVNGIENFDHVYPESKLDPSIPEHCRIGTNIVNLRPMEKIANIKKSNKIVEGLLLEQVELAERFMKEVVLSNDQYLKFYFLTMSYKKFIHKVLGIELKDNSTLA